MFLFIQLCAVCKVIGQDKVKLTINKQEQFIVDSKITATSYQLSISLPMHYSSKDTIHYPVMYLLDGNYSFPIAHASRQVQDMFDGLENVIIVGIGYTWEQSLVPWHTGRWRDYLPTSDTSVEGDNNPWFLNSLNLKNGDLHSGGADAFIKAMKNEIMPLIEKKYKTNGDNGITGHSNGGLFASYCLVKEPKLFKRYGINSPALWWDKKIIFQLEKSFYEQNRCIAAKVFMSVGSLEGEMVKLMTDFADSLKTHHYKGLTLNQQIFENENHMSVIPASISRTLRVLYPKK